MKKSASSQNNFSFAFSFDPFVRVSSTSVYLEGEVRFYLESQRKKEFKLDRYLVQLFFQYKHLLPEYLPKNRKLKKRIQPRVGNRRRFSFRCQGQDFTKLVLMAKAFDVSLGVLISVLLELDRNKKQELGKKKRERIVITTNSKKIVETLTIFLDPFHSKMMKSYKYKRKSFYS